MFRAVVSDQERANSPDLESIVAQPEVIQKSSSFRVGGYPPTTQESDFQWIENLSMSDMAIWHKPSRRLANFRLMTKCATDHNGVFSTLDPLGGHLFVAGRNPGILYVFDVTTGSVLTKISSDLSTSPSGARSAPPR
jgi:hypothetical protein